MDIFIGKSTALLLYLYCSGTASLFRNAKVQWMMASWLVIVIVMALLQTGVVKVPARGNSGEITESEQGKKIFVARCAKCHDDDMKKKLPEGSNLFTRLSASKDPKLRLGHA